MGASITDYEVPAGATVVDGMVTGTVSIPTGSTSATVSIIPVDDRLIEPGGPEALQLRLLPAGGYVPGGPATAFIADNDLGPSVSISATKATAYRTGTDSATFTVSRTTTDGDITVHYVTATQLVPVDQVVVSSALYPAGSAVDGDAVSHWLNIGNANAYGAHDDTPMIRFVFQQPHTFGRLRVSNYNVTGPGDTADRGAKSVEILASMDGVSFTSIASQPYVFDKGSSDPTIQNWQEIDLGGLTASAIEFRIKSNYYDWTFYNGKSPESGGPGLSYVGLGEAQFFEGSTASNAEFRLHRLPGRCIFPRAKIPLPST